MSESEIPVGRGAEPASSAPNRSRRGPRAKRKPSATRPAPSVRRKPASAGKRKVAASSRGVVRRGRDLETLVRNLAKKASGARDRLASASGDGAQATRRAFQRMSDASRQAIGRLGSEWKKMEPATKVQVLAALFTTLAAASAPLVRKSLRKR
jgi:hypothetical protein